MKQCAFFGSWACWAAVGVGLYYGCFATQTSVLAWALWFLLALVGAFLFCFLRIRVLGLKVDSVAMELLAMIFISLMGSAMLVPMYRAATPMESGVQCMSNLRQMGYEVLTYSSDFDGNLPESDGWKDAIFRYQRGGFPQCSLATTPESYGMNSNLDGKRTSDLPDLETVLLFEINSHRRNPYGDASDLALRHNGEGYFCSIDGAVGSTRSGTPIFGFGK